MFFVSAALSCIKFFCCWNLESGQKLARKLFKEEISFKESKIKQLLSQIIKLKKHLHK